MQPFFLSHLACFRRTTQTLRHLLGHVSKAPFLCCFFGPSLHYRTTLEEERILQRTIPRGLPLATMLVNLPPFPIDCICSLDWFGSPWLQTLTNREPQTKFPDANLLHGQVCTVDILPMLCCTRPHLHWSDFVFRGNSFKLLWSRFLCRLCSLSPGSVFMVFSLLLLLLVFVCTR